MLKEAFALSINGAASSTATYQAYCMVKAQKMVYLIGLADSFLIRMKVRQGAASGGGERGEWPGYRRVGEQGLDRLATPSRKYIEALIMALVLWSPMMPPAANRPYWAMVLCT